MSYLFAIVTFLVGAALGVSVARRRILASSKDSVRQPESAEQSATLQFLGKPENVLGAALNSLLSGVVITDAKGQILFKNSAAEAISGVRHVDVLVDEAVLMLLKNTVGSEPQHRRFDTAGTPSRSFDQNCRSTSVRAFLNSFSVGRSPKLFGKCRTRGMIS